MTNEQTFLFNEVRDELLEACRKALQHAADKLGDAGIISGVSLVGMFEGSGSAQIELSIATKPKEEDDGDDENMVDELLIFSKEDLEGLAKEHGVKIKKPKKKMGLAGIARYKRELAELLAANLSHADLCAFIDEEDEDEEEEELIADLVAHPDLNELIDFADANGVHVKKRKTKKFKNEREEREYKRDLAARIVADVTFAKVEDFLDGIEEEEEDEEDDEEEYKRVGTKLVKVTPKVETPADRLVSELKVDDLKRLCDSLVVTTTTSRKVKGEYAPTKLEMAEAITSLRQPSEIKAALVALNLPHAAN